MTPSVRVRSVGLTHPGLVRSANEDALLRRDADGVWIVADGMGGHENGQWASQTIVKSVETQSLTGDFDADMNAVGVAILSANAAIHAAAASSGRQMGSTVTALCIAGDRFACFWAGDSRIYRFRDGALLRLSRDHTQVQAMVDAGLLSPDEAAHHPMGHVLARAVGVQPELELDTVSDSVKPRDVFLLCSDGLTGFVSDGEIAERLGGFTAEAACGRLLELVLARGASDNVTMVAVTCEELTALVFGASAADALA